jgi:hypothetical protein
VQWVWLLSPEIHAVGCDLPVKRKEPWQLVFARSGWNSQEPVGQSARHGRCGPVAGQSSHQHADGLGQTRCKRNGGSHGKRVSTGLGLFAGVGWLGVAPVAGYAERPRDALHSRPWRREALGDWQTCPRPRQACFGPDHRADVAQGLGKLFFCGTDFYWPHDEVGRPARAPGGLRELLGPGECRGSPSASP